MNWIQLVFIVARSLVRDQTELAAEKQFRKIRGYKLMPKLLAVLFHGGQQP